MKKTVSIIICTAAAVLLSGCAAQASETNDITVSEETSLLLETSETAEAAAPIPDNGEYTVEVFEEVIDEDDDAVIEDDFAEPVEEPVDYSDLTRNFPANTKLYEMDDDNMPDMPEFTMSTDALDDYDRQTIERIRLRIKSILDCAVSGEVPAYSYTNAGYVSLSPQKLTDIRLNGWEIADEKLITDGNLRYEVTVTLDVAESDNEFVTVGKDDYLMIYYPGEDRLFLPLRKVGELDESRLLPGDHAKEYVNFCTYYTAYFRDFFDGDVVDDLSAPDTNLNYIGDTVFCAYVAAYRAGGFQDVDIYNIPYDEFNETLKKALGFSADAINAKNCPYYNVAEDTIEIPGRGTSWLCGWLAEDINGDEDGVHVVTIDYYEDDFYLVKSRTVRYTVRENDDGTCSMLKIERLFTSDRGILGGSV